MYKKIDKKRIVRFVREQRFELLAITSYIVF